jgi:hypothetical protein
MPAPAKPPIPETHQGPLFCAMYDLAFLEAPRCAALSRSIRTSRANQTLD